MKALMKIFAILLTATPLVSASAYTDEPVFIIKRQGERSIVFEMKELKQADAEITIQNEAGEALFSEYIVRPSEFERVYNLEALVNGHYYIKVEYGSHTQLLPVNLTDTGIELNFSDLVSL